MPLVIAFLAALGIFLDGLGHAIDALSNAGFFHWLGSIEWSAPLSWFRNAPTAAPQLSPGDEALYSQFQELMDMQFQVGEMKRQILTLPALPNEGY